jgi:hypothetical protein
MLLFAELALRRPPSFLLGALGVTVVLALGFGRLELRTEGSALHPPGNETVRQTEIDRRVFHDSDQVIVVAASRPGGPAVASPEGLTFLEELDGALRRLPGVRSSGVRSLAGLVDLRFTAEEISTDTFLSAIPDQEEAFSAWMERIRRHPLTDGLLLSRDGTAAALYVPRIETHGRRQLIERLERFLAGRQAAAPFDFYITGPLVAESLLGDMVLSDLSRLIPIMVAVIFVLLWLTLRTVGGLLIPFLEVMAVLVWTLGAMAWTGVPITLVTTMLPVVLMAMAITDEIHLLERFQNKLRAAIGAAPGAVAKPPRSQVECSLLEALREVERPIIATSLTTAIGLLAFVATSVTPLRQFGVFSALGILVAMVLTFTAIPAAITLLPARWFLSGAPTSERPRPRAHESLAARLGGRGLLVAGAALAVALPGTAQLRVEDNWIANFDPSSPIVAAERRFEQSFWGGYRFDVVLSGPPGYFFRPEGVSLMEALTERAGALAGVEGVSSYLVPVGEVARAAGEPGPLAALPGPRLGDFVTLATMSEDPFGLRGFVTADGAVARARLFLAGEDYRRDRALAEALRHQLAGLLADREVTAHFSGDVPVGLEMVRTIVSDQLRSIAMAFAAIAALVLVTHRRGKWSAAILLPAATATVAVFGGMGYAGLPLGIATSMFATLVLGAGVDFGFHFLHGFQRESRRHGDPQRALAATLATTGKAIRWNAVVLAIGFSVLAFSALRPNHSLGLLLAAGLAAAYVMTLLLLPGLLAPPVGRRRQAAAGAIPGAESG